MPSPSRKISSGPPLRVAITGSPVAKASAIAIPKVSRLLVDTKQVDRQSAERTSARSCAPRNSTFSELPFSSDTSTNVVFSGPSPRISSLASGIIFKTAANALIRKSTRLFRFRLATVTNRGACGFGRLSGGRVKNSVSTGFGMTLGFRPDRLATTWANDALMEETSFAAVHTRLAVRVSRGVISPDSTCEWCSVTTKGIE